MFSSNPTQPRNTSWMLHRKFDSLWLNLSLTVILRLRLALYKGMGFEPIVEKDGHIAKMLVRE